MKFYIIIIIQLLFIAPTIAQTLMIPDLAFRSCLERKIPTAFDSRKNLIISEAVKLNGSLMCNDLNIKNIEGIQYFTNIEVLSVAYNKLYYLPDLSPLKKLQVIDLSDNQLEEVMDFNFFPDLRDLDLKNNKLKKFPDISSNTKLEVLSAAGNQFDSIPDLTNLVKLRLLYIQNNEIVQLPELKSLTSLTLFNCSNNKISDFPALVTLKSLSTIDISRNRLTKIPDFPAHSILKNINLSHNKLTGNINLPESDSLKLLSLQYNNFSFKDLLPLSKMVSIETNINIVPQSKKQIGKLIQIKEGDSLLLKSGIDDKISGVNYEWIFNNVSLSTQYGDSLLIKKAGFNNQGYYYCRLTHPSFSQLVIETDSFFVNVTDCVNLSEFSLTSTSITCERPGTLVINSLNKANRPSRYYLKGTTTGKTMSSETGNFAQLTEPYYKLQIQNGTNCLKDFPELITVPIDKCEDPFITPDGDGLNDTHFFNFKGKAVLTDKWGNVVHTLKLPEEWNGANKNGLVSPGLYYVDINEGERLIRISVVY